MTLLSERQAENSASSSNTSSMLGTTSSAVTPWSFKSWTNSEASQYSDGSRTTSRAPAISAPKISQTEASKLKGYFCRTVSASPKGKADCIHTKWLQIARVEIRAPLGAPVEPDV